MACQCQNGATCDRFTGNCSCLPGFTGRTCENSKLLNTTTGHSRLLLLDCCQRVLLVRMVQDAQ